MQSTQTWNNGMLLLKMGGTRCGINIRHIKPYKTGEMSWHNYFYHIKIIKINAKRKFIGEDISPWPKIYIHKFIHLYNNKSFQWLRLSLFLHITKHKEFLWGHFSLHDNGMFQNQGFHLSFHFNLNIRLISQNKFCTSL